jgi:F-type H+-transporting ATPase subunit a
MPAFFTGISFFNNLPEFKLKPPTRDINTTAALAIMSILVVLGGGIAVKGPRKWLKSFLEPIPIILPFKILDYFIRPTSLALRLFGNILGGFIFMELIYAFMSAVVPAALSLYFDLFDGLIQAYVFVFLTSFYIAESVE